MKLTETQKTYRRIFKKMTYQRFADSLRIDNNKTTNPVEIMMAAENFKNSGMMDGKTYKRICDGAFKVIYGMRREWE